MRSLEWLGLSGLDYEISAGRLEVVPAAYALADWAATLWFYDEFITFQQT